jgi:hypothetical protein
VFRDRMTRFSCDARNTLTRKADPVALWAESTNLRFMDGNGLDWPRSTRTKFSALTTRPGKAGPAVVMRNKPF